MGKQDWQSLALSLLVNWNYIDGKIVSFNEISHLSLAASPDSFPFLGNLFGLVLTLHTA